MEFFAFFIAIGCSLLAYWLEQRRWTTLIRTCDIEIHRHWLRFLEQEGIEYREKRYTMLAGDVPQTVYLLKVLSKQVEQITPKFLDD